MNPFCALCRPLIHWLIARGRRMCALKVSCPYAYPLAWLSMAWGVVLASQPDLFTCNALYAPLILVAPEWAWALVMFGAGCILQAGALVESRRVLRIGLICATAIWTFTAVLFGLTGAPTGLVSYGVFAAMAVWALLQIGPRNGHP